MLSLVSNTVVSHFGPSCPFQEFRVWDTSHRMFKIPLFFRRCHWSSWENRRELLSLQTLASAMLHWDPFYIFYHFPTKHSDFNCTWRELNWNIMKRLILQIRLDLVLHLSLMFRIFHIWSSSLDCRGMFAASIRPSWLPSLLMLSASGSILFFSSSTNKNIFKLWKISEVSPSRKSSNALKKRRQVHPQLCSCL